MTAYAYDRLPPDAPADFALRLGDWVRVETATLAIPFVGRITGRLCGGRVMVESRERARMTVRVECCRIVLARGAAGIEGDMI